MMDTVLAMASGNPVPFPSVLLSQKDPINYPVPLGTQIWHRFP